MSIEQFIREAFSLPPTVIEYHVSQSLKRLFPKKGSIEVDGFDVEGYANAQQWITRPGQSTMEQVMIGKVATLREQMVSAATLDDGETESELPGPLRRLRGHRMI